MKCRKCGKKMEKRSKRGYDSYYCKACGAQAKKISRKRIIQETAKTFKNSFKDSAEEDINNISTNIE